MNGRTFQRFAGLCAVVAALGGVAYGVAFIILGNPLLYSVLLMLGGLLSTVVLTALHDQLREASAPLATWALLIGVVGALGSVAHGGYDLANAIHPPDTSGIRWPDLPNPIDARGLLTFGFAGLSLLVFSALINRADHFPAGLGRLGYVLGALLIVIYLGRLIILDPTNPIVRIALLAGLIANTIWFVWLGLALRRA
jgi:hypothetical protein